MNTLRFTFLAVAFSVLLPAPTHGGYTALGTANTYNEFVLGDTNRFNVESQGAVAVGGNANFDNFTILNDGALNPNALVVGGSLTFQSSPGTINGNVVAGGSISAVQPTINGSVTANGVTGINFAAQALFLRNLSAAQVGAGDTLVSPVFGGLTFAGSAAPAATFFDVMASDFSGANSYTINASAGSTVVINVLGDLTGGINFQNAQVSLTGGITADRVLFNFRDATALSINALQVAGSVLAPNAAVSFSDGAVDGNLIAASLSGNGETHYFAGGGGESGTPDYFSGDLRGTVVTPAPSSLLLLVMGLLCLGGYRLVRPSGRRTPAACSSAA